ncbi:MAG: molybdopterin-dependent oxidoreductase [Acidobacteriota bacterium]
MPSRRSFLRTLSMAGGASLAAGTLGHRLSALVDEGILPAPPGLGIERMVPTACGVCSAGCGMRVRLIDDLPVGLAGNPLHPATRGGLCPAGHGSIWNLLSDDRLRSPLRRRGPRSRDDWDPIGWDDAMDMLAARLQGLRSAGSPEQFLIMETGQDFLAREGIDRFLHAYGSPNHCLSEDPDGIWRAALQAVLGSDGPALAPDLGRAGSILSLGHELLETDGQPVWQSKEWGRLRGPEALRVPVFIYAGARITPTGAKADLFLPCRPGTEGTVALGIAGALFQEDLVDAAFLSRYAEDQVDALRRWLRGRFHPLAVEKVSGVSPDRIFRAARALGQSRGLALIGNTPLERATGPEAALATVILNTVLGSIGRAGGWIASPAVPLRKLPPVTQDATGRTGRDRPRLDAASSSGLLRVGQAPGRLWHRLRQGSPYRIDTMLICGTNLLRELPDPDFVAGALDEVPFIAYLAERFDETARLSDLVLPLATCLETWGLTTSEGMLPFPAVALRQPIVGPLGESRGVGEVLADLATRCGAEVAGAVPANTETWVREAVRGLHENPMGIVPGEPGDIRISTFLESGGWRAGAPDESWPSFWERFCNAGVWAASPPHHPSRQQALGPSRRITLFTAEIRKHLDTLSDPDLGGRASRALRKGDPSWVSLLVGDSNTLWKGRAASTPLMREMASFRHSHGWESICEVNPLTGNALGLSDNAPATLSTKGHRLRVRVKITSAVPPGHVGLVRGLSATLPGTSPRMRTSNPMELILLDEEGASGHWVLDGDAVLEPDSETA